MRTFLVALIAIASITAHAETLTLRAVSDASLIEENSGAYANGSGPNLFAGRIGANAGSTLRRALIRFDVSALPSDAVIQSASVTLYLTRSRFAGDLPFTLHRVTAAWNEGPSNSAQGNGDSSVNGDSTWLHRRKPDLLWATPGGDYIATASATHIITSTGGPHTWQTTPQLLADIQQWRTDPSSNHGWLIKGFEGPITSAKGFSTKEAERSAEWPRLHIEYSIPTTAADGDVPLPAWAIVALSFGLLAPLLKRHPR